MRFIIKGLSLSKYKPYGYDPLRNMVYLNSSKMTKENCLAAAKLVARYKPSIFEGYARSFIDFYNNICNDYKIASPRGIFVYGETVTQPIREFVQSAYGAHLYDFYSHAENAVMICEKPDQKKYLMEDYFYPEIVDPQVHTAVDGYGELVGTSFYNYAMPFIRYQTRDYISLAEYQESSNREVMDIEGRMDDYLILPNGRKEYFADGALGYAKGIITAQYIQEELNLIRVNLIVDNQFKEEYFKDIEDNFRKIKGIDNSVVFKFAIVDSLIKRESGKVPLIISRIPK